MTPSGSFGAKYTRFLGTCSAMRLSITRYRGAPRAMPSSMRSFGCFTCSMNSHSGRPAQAFSIHWPPSAPNAIPVSRSAIVRFPVPAVRSIQSIAPLVSRETVRASEP